MRKTGLRWSQMMTVFKTMWGLVLLLVLNNAQGLGANHDWQLKLHRDGIQVYQQQRAGFKFMHTKGTMTVRATAAEALAVLQDVALCSKWVQNCVAANRLDGSLVHIVLKAPLWLKDRDLVVSTESNYLAVSKQWQLSTDNRPGQHKNDDFVRINHTQSTWLITAVDQDHVHLSYELYADPELLFKTGVNKFKRDAMFQTMRSLRKLLSTHP